MHVLVIETIELVIALAILAFIAKFRATKPVSDSFFADHRWTLADAYKILLPFAFAGFIIISLGRLLPEPSAHTKTVLNIGNILVWCVGQFAIFWLVIKIPHKITASTFGLQKTEFLPAAVLPINVVTVLFLSTARNPPQSDPFLFPNVPILLNLLLLVTVIFVRPPLEELLWRGILYAPVTRRISKWQAIACLSLTESLLHMPENVEAIFWLFLGFLFLYFLYARNRSLYGPIIYHIGWNFIASRPHLHKLVSSCIDINIFDKYLIWSVLLFTICINLLWFIQKKTSPGQTLLNPPGTTLTDGCTRNNSSESR
jgi:membrane protease YdiL (CAAX protease family)